jgi:hypothetical protein
MFKLCAACWVVPFALAICGCQPGESDAERNWRDDARVWLDQRVQMPMDALENALTPQQIYGASDIQEPTSAQRESLRALAGCQRTFAAEVGDAPTNELADIEARALRACDSVERAVGLLERNLNDRQGYTAWNQAREGFADVWDDLH